MTPSSLGSRAFLMVAFAFSALAFSCASGSTGASLSDTAVEDGAKGARIADGTGMAKLNVLPGKKWAVRSFVFMKHTPSYAGWIETVTGEFVATLLVSGKAGSGGWIGAPEGGRPESLPVWYHAALVAPEAPEIDAVSAASSTDGATAETGLESLEPGREYVVFFEINHSFDYNDTWAKGGKPGDPAWSGVNGQPSLVYSSRFVAGKAETVSLTPIGHGSVDGSNGDIEPSLDGMTTAFDIAKTITLEVM